MQELGATVIVKSAGGNDVKQRSQALELLEQGVDALVIIPVDSRRSLTWTLANQPDALPQFHDLRTLPSERNDDIMGVTNLGDILLVFLRTKVIRVRFLPSSASTVGFDLGSLEVDVLSPDEGLAGGPRAYATFKTEYGRGLTAWTSDNS